MFLLKQSTERRERGRRMTSDDDHSSFIVRVARKIVHPMQKYFPWKLSSQQRSAHMCCQFHCVSSEESLNAARGWVWVDVSLSFCIHRNGKTAWCKWMEKFNIKYCRIVSNGEKRHVRSSSSALTRCVCSLSDRKIFWKCQTKWNNLEYTPSALDHVEESKKSNERVETS